MNMNNESDNQSLNNDSSNETYPGNHTKKSFLKRLFSKNSSTEFLDVYAGPSPDSNTKNIRKKTVFKARCVYAGPAQMKEMSISKQQIEMRLVYASPKDLPDKLIDTDSTLQTPNGLLGQFDQNPNQAYPANHSVPEESLSFQFCTDCGAKVYGKFCPECGSKLSEKPTSEC